MAFTVAQLTAIEEAIASGSLEVTFEGKTVKYPSIDDLERRRALIRADLVASGLIADTRLRTSVASFSKD